MLSTKFQTIVFLNLLMSLQFVISENNCEEKEKSLISLDVADYLITKAKQILPNCTGVATDGSDCGIKEKVEAHLDMVQKLISEAKENYPTCIEPTTKDPDIEDPVTKGPETKDTVGEDSVGEDPVTERPVTENPVTEGPVTEDPVTERPVTEDPVTERPVTEGPVTKGPVTERPVTEDPVTEEPATKKPKECTKCRDCSEVLQYGQNVSGVYTIWPSSSLFPNKSLEVFCDMDTDGGGWTVVQRRGNYERQEDFYRDWYDYKNGFGKITKDFWLGNDNIFILSNQRKYKIRFDLESKEGEKAFALYETFFIEDEDSKYKLHIGNYARGTAGDSMNFHRGMPFATKDRDNARYCAQNNKGGWWFGLCSNCHLNGQYRPGTNGQALNYIYWYHWKKNVGLALSEIKIKALVN